jgi:hypothetical protein
MFLFTTPSARDTAPARPVVDAIRQGAEKTGVGFDYLLATAQRESALDPSAKARGSSATGLFQFIEQTWLGLVKAEGAKHGLGGYANAIAARSDGSLAVADPRLRQAILQLRQDPQVASVMAGSFTQRNREFLAGELGREPTSADLYTAHFLGPRGAVDLIRSAQRTPRRSAAADFPDAAAANRTIFYDGRGRARGSAEVYALLAANHGAMGEMGAAPAFAPNRPLAFARQDGPALHGLFRTDIRRGPISDEVARLWRAKADAHGARTAALGGFFPRSTAVSESAVDPAAATAALMQEPPRPQPADVPLPPARPLSLEPAAPSRRAPGGMGRPLDLSSFMNWRRV